LRERPPGCDDERLDRRAVGDRIAREDVVVGSFGGEFVD
jgi:hypothetical protein